MAIKGYKTFDKGLVNRYGKVFIEGASYEEDVTPKFGNDGRGMHFCKRLEDTLRYFNATEEEVDIAEVTAYGDLAEGEDDYGGFYDMYATNKLRIDHVLTRDEILRMFLKMEPNERVKRFIKYFRLDDIELSMFQKVMVDDKPKTIVTYNVDGTVTREHTYTIKQIEDEIKKSYERNRELENVGNLELKLKSHKK